MLEGIQFVDLALAVESMKSWGEVGECNYIVACF